MAISIQIIQPPPGGESRGKTVSAKYSLGYGIMIVKYWRCSMYEKRTQPLLPRRKFLVRLFYHFLAGSGVLLLSLGLGVLGYHGFEGQPWLDALLNASMILGGMGPVNLVVTPGGKIFASVYAIYSGMIFLGVAGIIIAPILHRFLHFMHLDEAEV